MALCLSYLALPSNQISRCDRCGLRRQQDSVLDQELLITRTVQLTADEHTSALPFRMENPDFNWMN